MTFEPAIPYRKKQPKASPPVLICWNCSSKNVRRFANLEVEHSIICRDCGADGAPEDFRGVESTAAIVRRRA